MSYCYTHFHPITGRGYNIPVRSSYSDYAVWGSGHLVSAIEDGPLDAPEIPPSGGSTALASMGTIAHHRQMYDTRTPHACTFTKCVCGGNGRTVHVRNA